MGITLRNTNTLRQLKKAERQFEIQKSTKAEFINSHATLAVGHTSQKHAVAKIIISGIYTIHQII
jgi:hypothetical protein